MDPIAESLTIAPAVGIAVAGGPMVTLPEQDRPHVASRPASSLWQGLAHAGPVALAGLVVNAASVVVVVVVARLVSGHEYGAIAQLLGIFFVLSMPGSALVIGVVRRVGAWIAEGRTGDAARWLHRWHLRATGLVAVGVAVAAALAPFTSGWLGVRSGLAVFWVAAAGGLWMLLCLDRGMLQAGRDYRTLAVNLCVEGAVRTVAVIGLVVAGGGVPGYAAGLFAGELAAWAHGRWAVRESDRHAASGSTGPSGGPGRTQLLGDVAAAFVGLAVLALLQNMDVIVLGRLDPAGSGAYAAISVASKALVFGALALGSYLLPEATIRWHEGGHAARQLAVTLLFLTAPAAVLLAVSGVAPRWFIALFFSHRYEGAAPAFVWLVLSMMCLCVTVLLTNYLFGIGRRWVVGFLAVAAAAGVVLVVRAGGDATATAQADLVVQAGLAIAMSLVFAVVHHRDARIHATRWLHLLRVRRPAH